MSVREDAGERRVPAPLDRVLLSICDQVVNVGFTESTGRDARGVHVLLAKSQPDDSFHLQLVIRRVIGIRLTQ